MGGRSIRGSAASRVVVSVHDVAPSTLPDVRWLLGCLDGMGVRRVLKVVPAEDGVPLADGSALAGLLREEVAAGSEVVLHGYTHRSSGRLGGPALERLRGRLFAPSAAEFLALAPVPAAERVRAGRELLTGLGLTVAGFCPPGWLGRPELAGILAAEGFRYLLTLTALIDLRTGRSRHIPAIGYMGAGPIQERLVGVERDLVLAGSRAFPTLRLFLHPQGARRSAACSRALVTLERLVPERKAVTYLELLDA